jgi:hypothetical protein
MLDCLSGESLVGKLYTVYTRLAPQPFGCSLLALLRPLLQLEPQQAGLGTADGLCLISVFRIEGITATIQGVNLSSALFFFVGVFGQTVWTAVSQYLLLRKANH